MANAIRWIPLLLAIATLACNAGKIARQIGRIPATRSSWGGRAFRSSGDYVDLPRQLAEDHLAPGTKTFLACYRPDVLSPIERSLHLALSWTMSPAPVGLGPISERGDADAVFADSYSPAPDFGPRRLSGETWEKRREAGGQALWTRTRSVLREEGEAPSSSSPSPLREATGLVPLTILFTGGALLAGWTGALMATAVFTLGMILPPAIGFRPDALYIASLALLGLLGAQIATRRDRKAPARGAKRLRTALPLALLFGLLAAAMALSHTFMAPNGLGVSGGKAKLLYLAGGLPDGFFTDPARSTLQPAYPPGLALLTLGCYGFAGGCGEWLTQLLGPLATSALLFFLLARSRTAGGALWIFAAFLTPMVLQLASLYYAEPLMALFLLVGWERLREGRNDRLGWFLLGAAGFFKNEGLVLFLAAWIALRLLGGGGKAPLRGLAIGAALPLLWHLGCRLAGAHLYDYAPVLQPDISRWLAATGYALGRIFLHPWEYASAFPAALAAYGLTLRKAPRSPLAAALLAAALSLLAFTAIFSLSTAPDFAWHLHTAMPRLLWPVSLLLLRELAELPRTTGPAENP